jgi:ribosome biogenesis protein Nip4
MMRRVGHVAYKVFIRKPRNRWEDNIRMDLRKIGWEGVDRIHLAQVKYQQQALVNIVMNLQFS